MKFRVLLAGLLVCASATSAMAFGPYVGVSGGVSIFHDGDVTVDGEQGSATIDYDTGGAVNVAAGVNFGYARLEAEFGYKKADVNTVSGSGGSLLVTDTEFNIKSYMVNGYLDFQNGSRVTPFIGAGVGLLDGEFNEAGVKDNVSEFGYQVMVGVGVKATERVTFDLSYRYQGSSDFSKDGVNISYGSSNLLAGVRYDF